MAAYTFHFLRYPVWVAAFALASPSMASSPLFEDPAVLEVRLSGPVLKTIKDTRQRSEFPFVLSAEGADHNVMVRVRGNSRVTLCSFPPLRLNFTASETASSVFAGQNKLKLVTHCSTKSRASNAVLREYAAYRIFNLLSDASYRVRLVRVRYEDPDSGTRKLGVGRPQYGFLLEPTATLAARIAATEVEVPGVTLGSLHDDQEALVYLFQYLIGNIDWSLVRADGDDKCCHNIDILDGTTRRFIVPFDFDRSRFVDAKYPAGDGASQPRIVRHREYRGYCTSREALANALRAIKAARADILSIVETLPGVEQKKNARTIRYLESFFKEAEDEQALLQKLERNCLS